MSHQPAPPRRPQRAQMHRATPTKGPNPPEMGHLAPPVAAIRVAVRRSLAATATGDTVLVACSGGADSLALADAARFEARHRGIHCGLITVDHGLQAGSSDRAAALVDWAKDQGFAPVI